MKLELPRPPDALLEEWETPIPLFARSEPMEEFLRTHWTEGATFPSESFEHLEGAKVGVLWTNVQAPKGDLGRFTVGLAELFQPRPAKRWIMQRQVWAMHQLFGLALPDFVITLDALFWAAETVSIATKLALATHELLHLGQAVDPYGQPKYVTQGPREGEPVWCIREHDVEQFDLVVEWFGAEAAGVTSMVRAAAAGAVMRQAVEAFGGSIGDIEPFGCGTCGRKVA